jgi:hypothetical protein
MKYPITLILVAFTATMHAQTSIQNGDFELWENVGSGKEEPTCFNSNKTGTDWATSGPQTCYRDTSTLNGGSYSARIETKTFVFAIVNGSITTGIINAPTTSKEDGYIGTIKNADLSDIRRMSFVGRPDSLVGWYKYTQGGSAEIGKVKAILHMGHYYDPDTVSSYHPDSSMNKIAETEFLTPPSDISTWTRFSMAFNYVSSNNPDYIMINVTSSNDQLTSTSGSVLWLDDLSVVYNSFSAIAEASPLNNNTIVTVDNKMIYVDFGDKNQGESILSIYDLTGKIVSTHMLSSIKKNTVDISVLHSGLYLYQVRGDSIQKTGKLFL